MLRFRSGVCSARLTGLLLLLLSTVPSGGCAQSSDDAKLCYENALRDPDLAVRYCTATIESGKLAGEKLALTISDRGNAYLVKKDYDHAIQDFNRAIQLKHAFAEAFRSRGSAFAGKQDYRRAIQDFDDALRLVPGDVLALYDRGNAYLNQHDFDRAIADYGKVIQLKPDHASAFSNRGVAYAAKGDYDRAIQDFDQSLELRPGHQSTLRNREMAAAKMRGTQKE